MIKLQAPFLLCLGDATEVGYIKTALGLAYWRPDECLGQLRFPSCTVSTNLPDMSLEQARQAGVKSLILGVAPAGGRLPASWMNTLKQAIEMGMHIVSGLHDKLNDYPELRNLAEQKSVDLIDIRFTNQSFATGNGLRRSGKRLITVGTDCAVGKKYTALAIHRELHNRAVSCDFRATGQTGIMISGQGIPMDSTISDFTAGAAEALSPANDDDHWDIIEGQGAFFHPAYAGVTVALIQGSQPDALVLCHEAGRQGLLGLEHYPVPDIEQCIQAYELIASVTNPDARVIGISVNTSLLIESDASDYLNGLNDKTGLVCVDPVRQSVAPLVDLLLNQI